MLNKNINQVKLHHFCQRFHLHLFTAKPKLLFTQYINKIVTDMPKCDPGYLHITVRLTLVFRVGDFLKSILQRQTPPSWSLTSSRASRAGASPRRKVARGPSVALSAQWTACSTLRPLASTLRYRGNTSDKIRHSKNFRNLHAALTRLIRRIKYYTVKTVAANMINQSIFKTMLTFSNVLIIL